MEGQKPSLDSIRCDIYKELGHYAMQCPKSYHQANAHRDYGHKEDYQNKAYHNNDEFETFFIKACSMHKDNTSDNKFS